jgi:tRNA(Arg) A34 adenosine deaminase TadA
MTRDKMITHVRAAGAVAREAAEHGHHPFGAVLVGPDDRILMRQGNIDTVRHAETELARRAAAAYSPEFLWTCTLVSNGAPCAMCTGTLYWANIGRLVYGFEETSLLALTGNHPENPTMNLPSRAVLASQHGPALVGLHHGAAGGMGERALRWPDGGDMGAGDAGDRARHDADCARRSAAERWRALAGDPRWWGASRLSETPGCGK